MQTQKSYPYVIRSCYQGQKEISVYVNCYCDLCFLLNQQTFLAPSTQLGNYCITGLGARHFGSTLSTTQIRSAANLGELITSRFQMIFEGATFSVASVASPKICFYL